MKRIVKYIVERTYKPLLVKYLSKTRAYSYKGIVLEVPPDVFHPGFFSSTKILLRYISKEHLEHKKFLEPGAGSGLLSMYAAKKNASVTSTDINPVAIEYLKKNAETNGVKLNIVHSDLFQNLSQERFDVIIINPPYYKKQPVSNTDYGWYCGENGEYFQKLFSQLPAYIHHNTNILMVLCDGCDLKMIERLAGENSFQIECVFTKQTMLEKNYIFKINRVYR